MQDDDRRFIEYLLGELDAPRISLAATGLATHAERMTVEELEQAFRRGAWIRRRVGHLEDTLRAVVLRRRDCARATSGEAPQGGRLT